MPPYNPASAWMPFPAVKSNIVAILFLVLIVIVLFHKQQSAESLSHYVNSQQDQDNTNDEPPPVWYRLKDAFLPSEEEELIQDPGQGQENLIQDPDQFVSDLNSSSLSSKLLQYRQNLEQSPYAPIKYEHSSTFGFSNIYVVSLASRPDRRERMQQIGEALGAKLTFIDATSLADNKTMIEWIAEQAYRVRQQKRDIIAKHYNVKPEKVGGMNIDCVWLARSGSKIPLMDAYEYMYGHQDTPLPEFPSLNDPERFDGQDINWVEYLDQAFERKDISMLQPENPGVNVTELLWDPLEPINTRQIVPAVLATYHSHLRAVKTILENNDEDALILEDDVDFEWDFERMWTTMKQKIGTKWDLAFLGHCWGYEATFQTELHPQVFNTNAPRCLHGYAVTYNGAKKFVDLFSDPWLAYQAPIDTGIPAFMLQSLFKSYSLEPPLIIQAKDGPSDIQPGQGSAYRGLLADSTLERIWRDEGKEVLDPDLDATLTDPAVFRAKVEWDAKPIKKKIGF